MNPVESTQNPKMIAFERLKHHGKHNPDFGTLHPEVVLAQEVLRLYGLIREIKHGLFDPGRCIDEALKHDGKT